MNYDIITVNKNEKLREYMRSEQTNFITKSKKKEKLSYFLEDTPFIKAV